jgi:hypothetical protein
MKNEKGGAHSTHIWEIEVVQMVFGGKKMGDRGHLEN